VTVTRNGVDGVPDFGQGLGGARLISGAAGLPACEAAPPRVPALPQPVPDPTQVAVNSFLVGAGALDEQPLSATW